MKKTIIYLFIAMFSFLACKREEDPIFDKNASHRMNEAIDDVYSKLQNNKEGWMIKYYPSKLHTFGGYTIFAKFLNDTDVQLTSDINDDKLTSTYTVKAGSGATLSFDSYNKIIHFFSEPGKDSGVGASDYGMEGDFEFLVLEATDENIKLKGNKTGNIYEMFALKSGEFATLSASYQTENTFFSDFDKFEFLDTKGMKHDIAFSYRTFQELKEGNNPLLPFRVVPKGIEFFEEVEMDGVKFKTMSFKEKTADYPYGYYTDSSDKIKIYPVVTPLNQWFVNKKWAMRRSGHGPTGLSWWNAGRTRFINNGYTLNYVYFGTVDGSDQGFYVDMTVGGVNSVAYFVYNLTPVPGTIDEVTSAFGGSYASSAAFKIEYWNNAIIYLVQHLNTKTFKVSAATPNKPDVIKLTDKADPNNTIELFLGDIKDPLNK